MNKNKGAIMKIIEHQKIERDYNCKGNVLIVESSKHGRLLLQDGFGGMDSLSGGAVRFRHGTVIKLKPNDTIESLKSASWNDSTTLMQAVCNGYDNERPILSWSGKAIQNLALKLDVM